MSPVLRPWNISDLEQLVSIANNINIAKNLTNQFPHPYTEKDGIAFIERATNFNPPQVFAIDLNGTAIGGIGIFPQSDILCKNAEIGYWLGEPYWGKGYMSKCIPEIVAYGFKTFDINRIFARPFGHNIASARALEKAGFVKEGHFVNTIFKFGEYVDELFYAIRKS